MGSVSCPLCCGRLFKDRSLLKRRLLMWNNDINCSVCLMKFNTILEFANHLDDVTCEPITPRPRATALPGSKASLQPKPTISNTMQECSQVNVRTFAKTRMPYQVVISNDVVEVMSCEQDGDRVLERWEEVENEAEQVQNFCESCNCTIEGVQEHIDKFHSNEMVEVMTAEDDHDASQDLASVSHEDDYTDFILPSIGDPACEEEASSFLTISQSVNKPMTENEDEVQDLLNLNNKERCPELVDEVHESNKHDGLETPHVQIEKFWEQQFWKKQAVKALLSQQEKRRKTLSVAYTPMEDVLLERKSLCDTSLSRTPDKNVLKPLCNGTENEQDGSLGSKGVQQVRRRFRKYDSQSTKMSKVNSPRQIKPRQPTFCEDCGIKFKSHRSLLSHMKSHLSDSEKRNIVFQKQFAKPLSEPAICDICNTEFKSHKNLRMHMKMHRPAHSKKPSSNLECEVCHMVCSTEQGFRVHSRIHTPDKEPSVSTDNHSLVTTPQSASLKCKLCKMEFFSNEQLVVHWQSHNQETVEKPMNDIMEQVVIDECQIDIGEYYTCGKCNKRIANILMDDHEKIHQIEARFACSICNKHFPCETDLGFHIATHQRKVEYECHECKASFINAAVLDGHMKRVHSGANRPFPCGFCGRRFARPFEKVTHERIHTGEKPFECGVCGMKFRTRSCFKLHERIHTGVRPYTCNKCGKTFRSSCNYNHHIRRHSDLRNFSCPICPKTFKTSVALAGHRAIHFKRYACPQCGRRFATMFDMREHLNYHLSGKHNMIHKCYICGATYIRKYALRDHILTHGPNVLPPSEEESLN